MTTRWFTIPEICADLSVTEAEWQQWRERGETPLHLIAADGQPRVRQTDLDRWLDSLPDDWEDTTERNRTGP